MATITDIPYTPGVYLPFTLTYARYKKGSRILPLVVAFVLAFATLACADEMDARIARAFAHIEESVRSGSMTRTDAHRLKDELRNLTNELDRLEKQIYRDTANDHNRHEGRGRDEDRGGPPHFGRIVVTSGSYGVNVGAPAGNVTAHLATQCNGEKVCDYRIDYKVIGDPKFGRAKNYIAQWRCGDGPVQSITANAEAGFGSAIRLSCP